MTSNVAHDEQKTVWIIGAGASSSHTGGHFPTLLGLPQAADRLGLLDDRRARLFQRRFLDDYLVERGFPSLASNRSLNLEAVLTALEIDIAVSPSAALYTAQDRLLTLLRETINAASVETTATLGEYDKLVQKLREEDSVITFNWDCLLDDAMGRKAMLQDIDKPGTFFPRIDPKRHYGRFLSAFTGWGESTMDSLGVPGPVRQWQGRSGYLIKAHGSVDWFYCENESCRGYQSAFPMHDQADLPICEGCAETMRVLLVPPTLNKRLRELPAIRKLWTFAAREIATSTEIILWGYSLPPTDFFSDWLLRNNSPRFLKRVRIINPDAATDWKTGLWNTGFVSRFTQALCTQNPEVEVRIHRCFRDFEDGIGFAQKASLLP